MSIGSISPGTTASADTRTSETRTSADARTAKAERTSIADHVAAVDEHEPIRSVSATQGTLIDTYL